jgi:hypothetical protein
MMNDSVNRKKLWGSFSVVHDLHLALMLQVFHMLPHLQVYLAVHWHLLILCQLPFLRQHPELLGPTVV